MNVSAQSTRVLAIFVTYRPDLEVLHHSIAQLKSQECSCLVVDNASGLTADEMAAKLPSNTLIEVLESNFGLGYAQNVGLKHAQHHGFEYCLIMDQDSIASETMVAELISAHEKQSELHKVAAVGPIYRNSHHQNVSTFVRFGRLKFERIDCQDQDDNGCVATDFLISSGSLIRTAALKDVGLMDESLFIDHVDTEWFLRARSLGYKSFGACRAIMQHSLGEASHRVSLGRRTRNVPQHKPFRYYYIVRNSILLYKRPYVAGRWIWNDFQRVCMIGVMFGFLKAPRWQNLRMMFKGAFDGLRGVTGKLRQAEH